MITNYNKDTNKNQIFKENKGGNGDKMAEQEDVSSPPLMKIPKSQ